LAGQLDFLTRQDRAREAESLLGHRIFVDAMKALREGILVEIEACPLHRPEQLAVLHIKLKLVPEVEGALRSIVAEYKLRRKATDE
jgi:hypothetical protein